MSLNGIWFHSNHFDKSIESHVSDIIVLVRQELAKYIDTKHSQSGIGLYVENGEDCLVENGIANVFRRIGVCGDLFNY